MKDNWVEINKKLMETNETLKKEVLDHKQTEETLRESMIRQRQIIENSNAGYFLIDFEGYFQYVNSAWLKLHHYENQEEVIGKHFSISQVQDALVDAHANVEQLLNGQEISSGEFSRKCKDGVIEYHDFTARPVIKKGEIVGLEGFLIDSTNRKHMENEKEKLINELQEALENIKTLKGLFPICSSCKKIRDDSGYWNQIESYIQKHSEAEFSHGMCPECSDELYGKEDWYIEMKKENKQKE